MPMPTPKAILSLVLYPPLGWLVGIGIDVTAVVLLVVVVAVVVAVEAAGGARTPIYVAS